MTIVSGALAVADAGDDAKRFGAAGGGGDGAIGAGAAVVGGAVAVVDVEVVALVLGGVETAG